MQPNIWSSSNCKHHKPFTNTISASFTSFHRTVYGSRSLSHYDRGPDPRLAMSTLAHRVGLATATGHIFRPPGIDPYNGFQGPKGKNNTLDLIFTSRSNNPTGTSSEPFNSAMLIYVTGRPMGIPASVLVFWHHM